MKNDWERHGKALVKKCNYGLLVSCAPLTFPNWTAFVLFTCKIRFKGEACNFLHHKTFNNIF